MKHYYKDLAITLFENGYFPIPIAPRTKRPMGIEWKDEKKEYPIPITEKIIRRWQSNGKGHGSVAVSGLGGMDFDILNKNVSNTLINYIRKESDIDGKIPIRVGLAPKFLIPVSPESAIQKKKKNTWFDKKGEKHEIEFLSPNDQYFLTHGIHEDTGKEYTWLDKSDILNIKADDLPVVDEIDLAAIEDKFNSLADGLGWTRENPKPGKKKDRKRDVIKRSSDPLEDYKQTGTADIDELTKLVNKLPLYYCDNRDEWLKIGAAIHHGTDGSNEGYELFNTWSQHSTLYKNRKDTRDRWKSFRLDKKGVDAATVGSIVYILQEEGLMDEVKAESAVGYEDRIKTADSQETLRKIIKEVKKDKSVDNLSRSDIAMWIRDKIKKDLKGNWKLTDINHLLLPKKPNNTNDNQEDDWLQDWFFLSNQNKFAKIGNGDMLPSPFQIGRAHV